MGSLRCLPNVGGEAEGRGCACVGLRIAREPNDYVRCSRSPVQGGGAARVVPPSRSHLATSMDVRHNLLARRKACRQKQEERLKDSHGKSSRCSGIGDGRSVDCATTRSLNEGVQLDAVCPQWTEHYCFILALLHYQDRGSWVLGKCDGDCMEEGGGEAAAITSGWYTLYVRRNQTFPHHAASMWAACCHSGTSCPPSSRRTPTTWARNHSRQHTCHTRVRMERWRNVTTTRSHLPFRAGQARHFCARYTNMWPHRGSPSMKVFTTSNFGCVGDGVVVIGMVANYGCVGCCGGDCGVCGICNHCC